MLVVLLEKSSLPGAEPWLEAFSSGLFLPVAPRSPGVVLAHTLGPGHPGQRAADGSSPAAAPSKFSGIPGRALGDYAAGIWD